MHEVIRDDVNTANWKVIIALEGWNLEEIPRDLNYDLLITARDTLECYLDATKEES